MPNRTPPFVPAEANAGSPRVWVLLGEGAGGNAQMRALAEALGWPYETRQLSWNRLNHLPNPLLGATAATLDRHADALRPPWPDLVIAASRRSAPVARWIKKRAGGQTRLVHLLHAQMPLHYFDLVVTLPQFRLPEAPNVLHNTLPLNVISDARQRAAAARWAPRWAALPRPWVAVLVGGNSSSYRFDANAAAGLARQARARAEALGGSVLLTTSRRTPAAAARILDRELAGAGFVHHWHADDTDNPYPAFLALADRFIVTADSASLPAEACATGRPVALYDWRERTTRGGWRALGARSVAPWHRWLVYHGWLKPRRDFAAFHRRLAEAGLVGREQPAAVPDDMARTVARIRALFAD